MAEDKIDRAFKEIGHGDPKVILRDGGIVKIPAQEIRLPIRNGVQKIIVIPDSITNE